MRIPFNKPLISGKEIQYITDVIGSGLLAGEGRFTKQCCSFLETRYNYHKAYLTTSATMALEMAAMLIDIRPGDEVIMPSYTFVSTANAFALRGAEIVFADSLDSNPNIDESEVERLITPRTKAIVVIHYGGVACDIGRLKEIAERNNIILIEDASQAIHAFYNGRPLGGFGLLSAFSFHSTKNLTSGEGGALIVNDPKLLHRAEVISDKGTNRAAFLRGEAGSYQWVDLGSSCSPSEITSAFMAAQLERVEEVSSKRLALWTKYYEILKPLEDAGKIRLPGVPGFAKHNGHTFYLVCEGKAERSGLIEALGRQGMQAAFHYQSLHTSPYFKNKYKGAPLINSDRYTDRLVRLPLYYDLSENEAEQVSEAVRTFYTGK